MKSKQKRRKENFQYFIDNWRLSSQNKWIPSGEEKDANKKQPKHILKYILS